MKLVKTIDEKKREYNKVYYEKHREQIKKQYDDNAEQEREKSLKYHREHREACLERMSKYGMQNRDKLAAKQWVRAIKRNYGLTPEDWENMLSEQGGVCAICGEVQENRSLYVDHDHETGKVRGLLCRKCNLFLGLAQDDPNILRSAANYLENS